MSNYVDFNTLYGRLGNYPGDIGLKAAEALFRLAMKQPKGSSFVEVAPDGARATVILGTAARNLGGTLYINQLWGSRHQQSKFWWERGVKLFGLSSTVILPDAPGYKADFVLVRPVAGGLVFPDCKALFMLGGSQEFGPGWKMVEQGEGYVYAEVNGNGAQVSG